MSVADTVGGKARSSRGAGTAPSALPLGVVARRLGAVCRKALFSVSYEETRFDRRGFAHSGREIRQHLEGIGRSFLDGYHHALVSPSQASLVSRLDSSPRELRGFVYEGAGMGLAIRDGLGPRPYRLRSFLAGPGDAYRYTVQVGAGWALARSRLLVERVLSTLEEPLSWLAFDGYGFHEGYFHLSRWGSTRRPAWLSGYQLRAFDQGLGRSLWFSQGASAGRISRRISDYAPGRQPDLWSGVGLAATYAGGVHEAELEALIRVSGPNRVHLAQGAVFAAKARLQAGNPVSHTDLACEAFLGLPACRAAQLSDAALERLPPGSDARPGYEIWRHRIRRLAEPFL